MIPLYTEEEFNTSKVGDKLLFKCTHCNKTHRSSKRDIQKVLRGVRKNKFCSRSCSAKHQYKGKVKKHNCVNCDKQFYRKVSLLTKSKNHFCSSSCAATYNNKNMKRGIRRSKLELYLEEQLINLYPELEIHFNQKDAIGSELDIYIPSLNLAFELNGIFHYEPIFGKDKLNQIQENDKSKSKACFDNQIDLCIIDTSSQKYFKKKSSQKFLDIITNIVNERLLTS